MNIVMEEGNNTAYMVSGYEFNEEELSSLLQEPVFNKYNAIAKNGLAAALKEYYAAATNAEKVLILKSILDNMPFVELKRFSRGGCRLFAMCQSENDLPSSNEFPGNLSLARKLMANGYDVYMLSNPNGIRSADFIATKKKMVYYIEGKTMNGQESLDELLSKASSQSEIVVIDIIGTDDIHYIAREIKNAFVHNLSLLEVILLNGSRLISVDRRRWGRKDFEKDLQNEWMGRKK